MEEALLPDSEEDFAELSLEDMAVVSDFESEDDFESPEELESEGLESDEEELSLLEPFLLSVGGLGRP
ncbi:MAG: hypothetical protein QGI76_09375 [Dehalococcoidia bacterium]|nr:hypothetical protein [Dehalococcoidia bacterium]